MDSNNSGLMKCATPAPATASPAIVAAFEFCSGTWILFRLCDAVVAERELGCFPDRGLDGGGSQQRRLTRGVVIVGPCTRAVAEREQRVAEQLGHAVEVAGVG